MGSILTESEVRQLFDAADLDGNGSLDYVKFITATMHRHKLDDENLCKAFKHFDTDGSGFLTKDQLITKMHEHGMMVGEATIKKIIAEADIDKDGKISFEDFCTMMRSGTQGPKLF